MQNVRKTLRFSSLQKWKTERPQAKELCLSCAKELGIAPINQMIDNFGVSDEELEKYK